MYNDKFNEYYIKNILPLHGDDRDISIDHL